MVCLGSVHSVPVITTAVENKKIKKYLILSHSSLCQKITIRIQFQVSFVINTIIISFLIHIPFAINFQDILHIQAVKTQKVCLWNLKFKSNKDFNLEEFLFFKWNYYYFGKSISIFCNTSRFNSWIEKTAKITQFLLPK